MEVTRIPRRARRRLRSASARDCHSEQPTLMRSLLMSRKSTSLPVHRQLYTDAYNRSRTTRAQRLRHTTYLALSYIYELPFGKGRSHFTAGALSHLLGGWRISGTGGFRSGRPFTVRAGNNDSALAGSRAAALSSAFADCLRDGSLSGSNRTIDRWFDLVHTPPRRR